jgi:pimeloyl-ACP methyl ester carboxylesterase
MLKIITKQLALALTLLLCIQLITPVPAQPASAKSIQVKELNFVFLHGAGGNPCSLQYLEDIILEKLPLYIADYNQTNPGIEIRTDMLKRCYPGNIDIDTWAHNIADSINKYFANKKNLVLIGHSMGGKTALYTVANNIGSIADKVVAVITINSPIKNMKDYYVTGGASITDYARAQWFITDMGILDSVINYDSSKDGKWVSENKHWLAFISAEPAPLSEEYNYAGVDPLPRDMDDGIIPISAQYTDAADVVYYGDHGHSDFSATPEIADFIASQTLNYLFGKYMEYSIFSRSDSLGHKADWLLGTDSYEDVTGEVPVSSGIVEHKNESFTKWQEWEDVVGESSPGIERSSYQISRESLPLFTTVKESRWMNPDDPADCQLYLRTRAAPRTTVKVKWIAHKKGLLPVGLTRDHYEVEIIAGTPFTSINQVMWETDDLRDLRLRIDSEAQSPFRWFSAQWKVYYKASRLIKIIEEIPTETISDTSPQDSQPY